jgi:hypothetical protein
VLVQNAETQGKPRIHCSECGLEIDCAQIRSEGHHPSWFVETRLTRHWLATRTVATLMRTLRPFEFWSRVTMDIPLRWRGMIAFLLAVAIAAHVVGAAGRLWINQQRMKDWYSRSLTTADCVWSVVAPASIVSGERLFDGIAAGSRSGSYAPSAQGPPSRPWTARETASIVFESAFITGLREDDLGSSRISATQGWGGIMPQLVGPVALARLVAAAMVPMFALLALLLLPASLRMARVRAAHLLRAAVYSTVLLVPLLALAIVAFHARWPFAIGAPTITGRLVPHVLTVTSAALVLAWMAAICSRYLRLAQPWRVAFACTAIATLLSFGLSSLWFGIL